MIHRFYKCTYHVIQFLQKNIYFSLFAIWTCSVNPAQIIFEIVFLKHLVSIIRDLPCLKKRVQGRVAVHVDSQERQLNSKCALAVEYSITCRERRVLRFQLFWMLLCVHFPPIPPSPFEDLKCYTVMTSTHPDPLPPFSPLSTTVL